MIGFVARLNTVGAEVTSIAIAGIIMGVITIGPIVDIVGNVWSHLIDSIVVWRRNLGISSTARQWNHRSLAIVVRCRLPGGSLNRYFSGGSSCRRRRRLCNHPSHAASENSQSNDFCFHRHLRNQLFQLSFKITQAIEMPCKLVSSSQSNRDKTCGLQFPDEVIVQFQLCCTSLDP